MQVTATNALANGATAPPVTINSGGILETGSAAGLDSWVGAITLSGGTLSGLGTSNTTWGNWQMGGTVTVTAGTGVTSTMSAASVTLDETGGVTFNVGASGALSGIDLDVSGAIIRGSSAADNGLIKTGAGLMRLDSNNTYASATTIAPERCKSAGAGALAASGRAM